MWSAGECWMAERDRFTRPFELLAGSLFQVCGHAGWIAFTPGSDQITHRASPPPDVANHSVLSKHLILVCFPYLFMMTINSHHDKTRCRRVSGLPSVQRAIWVWNSLWIIWKSKLICNISQRSSAALHLIEVQAKWLPRQTVPPCGHWRHSLYFRMGTVWLKSNVILPLSSDLNDPQMPCEISSQ